MNLGYSREQEEFRRSLRGYLAAPAARGPVDSESASENYDSAVWQRMCKELDVAGLRVPEEYGGAGFGLVETALVFEELGRALARVPMAGTAFAIEAILRLGTYEQRKKFLPELITGGRVGALAVAGPRDTLAGSITVRAHRSANGLVLSGEKSHVLDGDLASLLVVPAVADGVVGFFVVDTREPGVSVERLPSLDLTRSIASIRFDEASAEHLSEGFAEDLERVVDTVRVLLAAEMLGGAQACLDSSVDYAKTRTQFNRPIGSFQAVKHQCAEMLIEIDATRAALMFAVTAAESDDPEFPIAAALVKAQAAETFVQCAGSAIQIYGGIGFTWEHDAHLFYRRAKSAEVLFGNTITHRRLLARRAGIGSSI